MAYSAMTVSITTNGTAPNVIAPSTSAATPRSTADAMWRGMRLKCPACGIGSMFHKYLKVADHCPSCGEALHHQRADDAPPYFTMFIVCHVVVAGVLAMEQSLQPDVMTHLLIWLPVTLALSLSLLPVVKGALIGLQWALRMHGFGNGIDPAAPQPLPASRTE